MSCRLGYLLILLALGPGAPSTAQLMAPALSPVVHADGSVTLALKAPAADSVKVIRHPGDPLPMRRGDDGVWQITYGPLAPGAYFYSFELDGVHIPDPENPFVHAALYINASGFVVPSATPHFAQETDVPRGALHRHRHRSATLGDLRGYTVYTPPGYGSDPQRRYPTLYLLHGYSDHERTWSLTGRVDIILDNLIAAGEAVPMVVVMPYGYAPPQDGDVPPGQNAWGRWFAAVTPRLQPYIVDELRGLVEQQYRVYETPAQRAIAGLSMGGGQALFIGLGNPDVYGAIGAFSSAIIPPLLEPLLADAAAINQAMSLLWVGCGRQDFLYQANTAFLADLEKRGIDHVAHITEGYHAWPVWHGYLRQYASRLFKE